jgi:undecaprenyl-diphosphatase
MAIIPGISRSGTTIAAATLLGIRGEDAARFSFLLAIPAILGALALQLPELVVTGRTNWSLYMGGAVAACISGLWAIRFLMKVIRNGRLRWFAVYCWGLGAGYLFFGP